MQTTLIDIKPNYMTLLDHKLADRGMSVVKNNPYINHPTAENIVRLVNWLAVKYPNHLDVLFASLKEFSDYVGHFQFSDAKLNMASNTARFSMVREETKELFLVEFTIQGMTGVINLNHIELTQVNLEG